MEEDSPMTITLSQRTLRELKVGRTLFKEAISADSSESNWVIRHKASDYKTGKTYGERPPLVIGMP